uniref:ATP synthase F0 subunit 8 n=1 Tax=Klapperibrachys cremeri TaxID=3081117 RepID=UPI002A81209B|nr:ATP synthase F0 subunit 8 [Klapperibrachys cremeri]WOW99077.1 ATP synthase F0 subunit 8 [Klapperibrachys cremeri]
MPQMSPTMWSMILMTTNMLILQINSMNMFDSINSKMMMKKKKKKKINWKW